ncbi:darcynin family protein [Silvibacterium sp.]|uniref:darcynin family protein n=1 Tax=Silvibacterium sp. TaxID=1964179 RepID=UPI0039E6AB15
MTTNEKTLAEQDDLTIFMLVKTMPEWLAMPVEERFGHFQRYVTPLLKKYEQTVRCRIFDTEFYSARVTDVWMWEAKSRHAYELIVEELRETPLWDRFFSIVEILAGVENAYARNYDREAVSA